MKQDMILILDLGSEENPRLAREIRAMGVYTEIHPHDLTADALAEGYPQYAPALLHLIRQSEEQLVRCSSGGEEP